MLFELHVPVADAALQEGNLRALQGLTESKPVTCERALMSLAATDGFIVLEARVGRCWAACCWGWLF